MQRDDVSTALLLRYARAWCLSPEMGPSEPFSFTATLSKTVKK